MTPRSDPLVRAWIALILLSALSTAIALLRPVLPAAAAPMAAAAILFLCWLKARVILGRYLGLDAVPDLRRVFDVVLGLFLAAVLGLYLAA